MFCLSVVIVLTSAVSIHVGPGSIRGNLYPQQPVLLEVGAEDEQEDYWSDFTKHGGSISDGDGTSYRIAGSHAGSGSADSQSAQSLPLKRVHISLNQRRVLGGHRKRFVPTPLQGSGSNKGEIGGSDILPSDQSGNTAQPHTLLPKLTEIQTHALTELAGKAETNTDAKAVAENEQNLGMLQGTMDPLVRAGQREVAAAHGRAAVRADLKAANTNDPLIKSAQANVASAERDMQDSINNNIAKSDSDQASRYGAVPSYDERINRAGEWASRMRVNTNPQGVNWALHVNKCAELSFLGCQRAKGQCAWNTACVPRTDLTVQQLTNTPWKCHQQQYLTNTPNRLGMGPDVCVAGHYCYTMAISDNGDEQGSQGCVTMAEFQTLYGKNAAVKDQPGCYYWDDNTRQYNLCLCNTYLCNTPDLWRT